MAEQREQTIQQLAVEICNIAHLAWTDPANAEYLFREIEKRGAKIEELASHAPRQSERWMKELTRSKMTFFYIRNLSHDAWRDPENLEAICRRIEDYAKMEYDLLTEALAPKEPTAPTLVDYESSDAVFDPEPTAPTHEPWCASVPRGMDAPMERGPYKCDCKREPTAPTEEKPCSLCSGDGTFMTGGHRADLEDAKRVQCPRCNGSGKEKTVGEHK